MTWLSDLDGLGCGAMLLDEHGRIQEANQSLLRWHHDTVPRGTPIEAILTPGSAMYWETAVRPMVAEQGWARDVALEIRGRAAFPVLLFAQLAFDGIRCLCVPFHERDRFDKAIARVRERQAESQSELERLQALDRMRLDFINAVAHEAGTPMTPIRLQLAVLRRRARDHPEARLDPALDALESSVNKLEHFRQGLVEAARVEAGQFGADVGPQDLGALAEAAVQQWQEDASDHDVDLRAAPCPAMADAEAFRKAFQHILDNAARFSPSGSTIHVRVDPALPGVEVRDEGRGIDPARITFLGHPFTKGHADKESSLLGSGLGLYVVNGLMRLQGGAMHIHSDGPGQGTTVRLEFAPVEAAEAEPARQASLL